VGFDAFRGRPGQPCPVQRLHVATHQPPTIVISIGSNDDGTLKDTVRNIDRRREFVVNIASMALLPALHASSAEYAPEISEVAELGLETAPSELIATPRVATAPVSAECRLSMSIEVGNASSRLVVGEIVRFHVRDDVYRNGRIDTELLKPIARLGGPRYAHLGEVISMPPVRKPGKHTAA
jgi:flavin reductase (DIM6/NTAB) family NADH-FMN oxidoreductase RutF